MKPAHRDTQKTPNSPGSASYPIPQHKDLLGGSPPKQAPDSVQGIVLRHEATVQTSKFKSSSTIVAFGYYEFPGAGNPKAIAKSFKFGGQGIICLFGFGF